LAPKAAAEQRRLAPAWADPQQTASAPSNSVVAAAGLAAIVVAAVAVALVAPKETAVPVQMALHRLVAPVAVGAAAAAAAELGVWRRPRGKRRAATAATIRAARVAARVDQLPAQELLALRAAVAVGVAEAIPAAERAERAAPASNSMRRMAQAAAVVAAALSLEKAVLGGRLAAAEVALVQGA
jgi:hypothetical protein